MPKKFAFHGIDYRYIRSRTKDYGYCKKPKTIEEEGVIGVSSKIKGKKELEINIHEFLHACGWFADEEWILMSGRDIATALWELGYRKDESAKTPEEGSD